MILAISVEGLPKNICKIILKSVHWSRKRCRFKKLLTDRQTDGGKGD